MVTTRTQPAPYKNTSPGTNTAEYLTVHETANTNKGANAAAHANLQTNGNVRSASWHETVDDKEAVISFPANVICWHAGTSAGNRRSYGLEICVNSDGDFKKAVDNAAQRAAAWLKARNKGVDWIRQHEDWSGKDCPNYLRDGSKGITWADFINLVKHYLAGTNPPPKPTPPKPGQLNVDGFIGPQSTRRWQEVAGTPVDGVITGQGWPDEPYHVRLESVQYQGNGDSSLAKKLQNDLKAKGYYKGKIDGYLGPIWIKAFQACEKLEQDGYFGPACAKRLQTNLNAGRLWSR